MTRPRAVTFDFHDTIAIAPAWFALEVRQIAGVVLMILAEQGVIGWDGAQAERAGEAYRALRQEITAHGREQDALSCVQHALRAVGVVLPDTQVAPMIDTAMASVRSGASPRPGIQEAVAALAEAGMPLAVISNAVYHPFLDWCLEDWGLAPYFTAVISSASCGFYKSHRGIYACALDALGTEAAATVHIGDSYRYDVEAAHRIGMRTVWLHLRGDIPSPCVADLVVEDLIGLAPRVLDLET